MTLPTLSSTPLESLLTKPLFLNRFRTTLRIQSSRYHPSYHTLRTGSTKPIQKFSRFQPLCQQCIFKTGFLHQERMHFHSSSKHRQNKEEFQDEDNSPQDEETRFPQTDTITYEESNKEAIDRIISSNSSRIHDLPSSGIELLFEFNNPQLAKSIIERECWTLSPIPSYYSCDDVRQWIEQTMGYDKIVHVQRSIHVNNTFLVFLQHKSHELYSRYKREKGNISSNNDNGASPVLDVYIEMLNNYQLIFQELRAWKALEFEEFEDSTLLLYVNALDEAGQTFTNKKSLLSEANQFSSQKAPSKKRDVERDVNLSYHLAQLIGYRPVTRSLVAESVDTAISNIGSSRYSKLKHCRRVLVRTKSPADAWTLLSRLTLEPFQLEEGFFREEVVHAEKW